MNKIYLLCYSYTVDREYDTWEILEPCYTSKEKCLEKIKEIESDFPNDSYYCREVQII